MTEEENYDWDSPIGPEADSDPFVVLPSGDYPFEVTALTRERYEGNPEKGTKPCPKATVTLKVDGGPELGEAYVKENIFLNRKNAWKIKSLFVCLGLVDSDCEEFVPNWTAIIGRSGTCALVKRQFAGNNGDMVDTNDAKRFLPPSAPATAPAAPVIATPAIAAQPQPAAPAQPAFSFPTAGA